MSQGGDLPGWRALVIGSADWLFLVEALLRTVVVYLLLLGAMRLMGKRLSAQLTISELAIVLSLGAVAGLPMQDPERGLLPALLVLLVAVGFQRGVAYLAFKRRPVELAVYGDVSILLKDGHLQMSQLRAALLPREKVLSSLRTTGVLQLGEVRRVYLEVSGSLSVMRYSTPRPGLPLLPDLVGLQLREVPGCYACVTCGFTSSDRSKPCPGCHHEGWVPAALAATAPDH